MNKVDFLKRFSVGVAAALLLSCNAAAIEVPVAQTEQAVDGRQLLTKVYEVSPETDPETLLEDEFERNGYRYSFDSILKETTAGEDRKDVSVEESVVVAVSKEDEARKAAFEAFPVAVEYDEDGYTGRLYPMTNTFRLSETGRTTHSGADSRTRTYTLDYNDDSMVPSSITDGGYTYNLNSVSWADGDVLDDGSIPENYVATAVYTRGYSYSTVDGYEATMMYSGSVEKEVDTMVRYTVTYSGQPLDADADDNAQSADSETDANVSVSPVAIVCGILGAAGVGFGVAGVTTAAQAKKRSS